MALAMRAEMSGEMAPLRRNATVSACSVIERKKRGNAQDGERPSLDLGALRSTQVARDVLHETLLGSIVKDALPEGPRLLEIEFGDGGEVEDGSADVLLVLGDVVRGSLVVREGLDGGLVVGSRALRVERHGCVGQRTLVVARGGREESERTSIALEVDGEVERSVDGELAVVGTETVALRVGVREEAGLEDGVGGGLDSGDEVRGGECDLLDLCETAGERGSFGRDGGARTSAK